jgi:hypothetical protein
VLYAALQKKRIPGEIFVVPAVTVAVSVTALPASTEVAESVSVVAVAVVLVFECGRRGCGKVNAALPTAVKVSANATRQDCTDKRIGWMTLPTESRVGKEKT